MWGISTLKQWRTTPPNHWQCRKLLLSQKWLEIKHRRRLAHIAQISLHSHEHLLDFRSESPCVSQLQEMSEMNSWFQGLLDEMSLAELKERLRIDPTSASCCCCCRCCYLQYCYQNSKIREGDTFHASTAFGTMVQLTHDDSWMWRRKLSHQLESNCSWNNGGPKKSPGSSPARLSHSVRKNWTWSVKGSQWQLWCRLWSILFDRFQLEDGHISLPNWSQLKHNLYIDQSQKPAFSSRRQLARKVEKQEELTEKAGAMAKHRVSTRRKEHAGTTWNNHQFYMRTGKIDT